MPGLASMLIFCLYGVAGSYTVILRLNLALRLTLALIVACVNEATWGMCWCCSLHYLFLKLTWTTIYWTQTTTATPTFRFCYSKQMPVDKHHQIAVRDNFHESYISASLAWGLGFGGWGFRFGGLLFGWLAAIKVAWAPPFFKAVICKIWLSIFDTIF